MWDSTIAGQCKKLCLSILYKNALLRHEMCVKKRKAMHRVTALCLFLALMCFPVCPEGLELCEKLTHRAKLAYEAATESREKTAYGLLL